MLQPCPKPHQQQQQPHQQEKKPRPADEQALKCPRCDSTNTKFCYYNNYSLSQPRYFCKSCRRYWTKGGTLRNVPVGGGCRRNKRSSTSTSSSSATTSSSSSSSKRNHDHHQSITLPSYDSNDLTLAIARLQKQGHQLGFHHPDEHDFPSAPIWGNPTQISTDILGTSSGMFESLRSNIGFLDLQNGFQSVYENGSVGIGSQLEIGGIPYEGGVVKQEMCNGGGGGDQSRSLWGFPWQNGIGNDNNSGSEFDHPSRMGWNGMVLGSSTSTTSNWHNGLLNSPLMSNIN